MFADLSRFLCAAPRSPRGEKLTSQHSAFGTWSIVIYTFRELIYVAPSSLYYSSCPAARRTAICRLKVNLWLILIC